ncbi:hypothetical protein FisN_26Hu139 [Fistulifera solaris]|uniref:Uncharacterized protein n=1 Tax=Fistulifera solaris TaxID=1519565 RepID=A0A1Z5JXT6_FISSO|nr:hypothetical protein FisN_26Hu139 [Fistulifera solaris]|eukprot:GAX18837.1 hypothetical protein FisN_26Hu139 [Fistulifera solaris]
MSNEFEDPSLLLGLILPSLRKPEQSPFWFVGTGDKSPAHYKLLRRPVNLQEFNPYGRLVIWRENGTLTYVVPAGDTFVPDPIDDTDGLIIEFGDNNPSLHIIGKTEDAIVETALFELAHASRVSLKDLSLRAEQSTILASKPYPIDLTVTHCFFGDDGTAFVDALEKRKSSFGSLTIENNVPISHVNFERLLQVEALDHLGLPILDDAKLDLTVFSAKMKSLACSFYVPDLDATSLTCDLQSCNIVAENLALYFEHDWMTSFPTDILLVFFRHLETLGHFKELGFSFNSGGYPEGVVQQLIRMALANRDLEVLDLSGGFANWDPHLETLLKGLKDHASLRTFKVSVSKDSVGPFYLYLRKLLSHNRFIAVMDGDGRVHTDKGVINEIYALNRCYRGSKALVLESPNERISLVTTALVESGHLSLQRSALLLADHTDVLLELIKTARLDEIGES